MQAGHLIVSVGTVALRSMYCDSICTATPTHYKLGQLLDISYT